MELQHRFTVPAGIEQTWAHFEDIAEVAGCFPGAAVTEADAESFSGTVKVKLGPIALVYNGTGTFVEKDEASHRMVIDAKGKDKRGNGTAGAMVTASMTAAGPDATDVEVLTDLNITGKAAQFGRGNVMKDVSDKLLGQFVACLETRLAGADPIEPSGGSGTTGGLAGAAPEPDQDAGPASVPTGAAAATPRHDQDAGAASAPAPASAPAHRAAPNHDDDALDLGATVLPVLARAYWKQGAAALAALLLVIWWVTRD